MALNLRRRFDINFDIWQEGPVNGDTNLERSISKSNNPSTLKTLIQTREATIILTGDNINQLVFELYG
jgi:hypothetical protein